MFIGEAPGFHEDKQGEPFVGAAGQLLTRMLGEIGLRREDVYIANVLKCRPPANRDPLPDEIEACTPWLVEQISIIQPCVGRHARELRDQVRVEHVAGHHEAAGTDVPVARTDRDPDVPPVGDPAQRRRRLEAVRAVPRGLPADRQDAGGAAASHRRPTRPADSAAGEPAAGEEQLELF